MSEVLYSAHKFSAENADEISLAIGEKIVILEKDEGFNDGWWKGRNEKGEVGLFPVTYTVKTPPSIEQEKAKISNGSKHSSSLSSKNIQSIVKRSLNNPVLKSKLIEEWNSEQVAIWLTEVGFDSNLADIFKDQEITGDILLELTADSLKELQIDTFGKRFKIQNAITALKNESKYTMESRVTSPLSDYRGNNSDNDDLVSNYSTVIRNSQLTIKNRPSMESTSSLMRKDSQSSTHSFLSQPAPLPVVQSRSNQFRPERRHTLSSNTVQENNNNNQYNYTRSSLNNLNNAKLQSVLPSSAMVRRSEDTPITHETSLIPDMEGWLYKQGDRYKNWNKRWFVLKGNNLFYFKSPKAIRMKGIVNLKGYRVEVDSSIQVGKYCFKAHHEKERTFYFYTDQEKYMKDWVKALMKATIERDYGTPVMSSSTIPTVSLETARRMRPRPPSTIFQSQQQKTRSSSQHQQFGLLPMEEEHIPPFSQSLSSPPMSIGTCSPSLTSQTGMRIADNTSDYSFDHNSNPRLNDSGFNSTTSGMMHSPSRSLTHSTTSSSSSGSSGRSAAAAINSGRILGRISSPIQKPPASSVTPSMILYPDEEDEDLIDPENASVLESNKYNRFSDDLPSSRHYQPTPQHHREIMSKKKEYIDWVNLHVQDEIHDLSELSTGQALLQLLESLSNREIKRAPVNINQSGYSQMMDRMITAFEYMHQEGIDLDGGYTFRAWYGVSLSSRTGLAPYSKHTTNKKTASGGTFGEEEENKLRALDDYSENILV
ncbi:hypothetical protein G6F26_001545 [Rhizopus arrhizus]|nr:hypothetical protein G6F21_000597 [Rhizopus arrhizus]KAG0889090.1 hypothetical protein G6F15_000977 [Rhizopus arrhizus]KAG0903289.1 hypothetical protein G6F34_001245 [Rhizopus arrhizus]KAG1029655.1 hypothetical protein G6F26_001545 [Rhizopus arrhizus]KAG1075338.1 hypothetical protein G6F41_000961 [Rhizopus arrhizus]